MPITITPPIEKSFPLTKSDEKFGESGTTVMIKQVNQGKQERRNDLFAEFKRTFNLDGTTTVTQRISFDDIKRLEVFLTMSSCNIVDGDTKKSLFTFENGELKDEVAFRFAWAKLPPIVADEIHEKVLEQNPMWSPEGDTPL